MPTSKSLLLAVAVAGMGGGFGLSLLVRPAPDRGDLRRLEAQVARLAETECPPVGPTHLPVVAAADSFELRREIRQILQEELRALKGAGAADAALTPPPRPPAPPTPEAVAALHASHRVVDTVIQSRRYTDREAAELRALLRQLDGTGRDEILGVLLPAINRGDVVVETSGPPF